MLHLELDIENADYDAIIDNYLPLLTDALKSGGGLGKLISGGMAERVLRGMTDESKDSLAAELLCANSKKITQSIEKYARDRGMPLELGRLKVTAAK